MFKKIVKTYYKLLDEKLENWTMVVLIIAGLIVCASLITKDTNALLYVKTNILETNKKIVSTNDIIMINWLEYRISLEEIKK